MLNRKWTFLAALAWLLTACTGAAQQTEAPTSLPTRPPLSTQSVQAQCTVVSTDLTASQGESIFPAVAADEWARGPASARLTIIEYSDFQ